MCNECANCCSEIDLDDTSILVTEDSQFLCGSCNECSNCNQPLDEHSSNFELWLCEDCNEQHVEE